MEIERALSWLEGHVNLEAVIHGGRYSTPTLDRMVELCDLMGDPQLSFPAIHITGTNGKGSSARITSDLLRACGLTVGTYTSPDLERINERLVIDGEPIGNSELAELLEALMLLEPLLSEKPSRFELLTAAALRWFSDSAVDVAVIEVGLGGTWDATNVVPAHVAVVTNVALDHTELLGPTTSDITREKAGIAKEGAVLVVGETDPELVQLFAEVAGKVGCEMWSRGEQFECTSNRMAIGGRLIDVRTPWAHYTDLFLPLHGAHQGENASISLAAIDAFFGKSLTQEVVEEGLSNVRVPGRLEIVSRAPLVILDGAHNAAGSRAAGAALDEEFSAHSSRVVVMGVLEGRDPTEMLQGLGPARIRRLLAVPAPSPRTIPAADIASAGASLGIESEAFRSVAQGMARALADTGPDELLLVTGSMYVVGAARTEILNVPPGVPPEAAGN